MRKLLLLLLCFAVFGCSQQHFPKEICNVFLNGKLVWSTTHNGIYADLDIKQKKVSVWLFRENGVLSSYWREKAVINGDSYSIEEVK